MTECVPVSPPAPCEDVILKEASSQLQSLLIKKLELERALCRLTEREAALRALEDLAANLPPAQVAHLAPLVLYVTTR